MISSKKQLNPASESRDAAVRQFEVAMALMSVIPLLGFVYLIASVSGLEVFANSGGFLAVSIIGVSVSGIILARVLISSVFKKLDAANRSLENASEMKTAFLRNVAHEAATPLVTARGNLIALRDSLYGNIPETAKEPLNSTLRQIDRLRRMAKDLLDIAQIEKGAFRMNWKRIDLNEVLGLAVETVRGVPDGGAKIVWEPGQPCWLERADSDRLVQVIVNLLRNAQKYSPRDSEVLLEIDAAAADHDVRVMDRGEGVPDAMKEKIFEPFIRGTEKNIPGVGLGLPISRHIAQLHGGRLWVEDRPGGGCVFTLRLPKTGSRA